jgi:hypothetical protein
VDMSDSIAPRSDQMNAEDLLVGPRTFTITDVKVSSAEQPVSVYLAEFPQDRPFKPSKTVRRLMVLAWGVDQTQYAGKRLTLYCDRSIRFGGQEVGGIRMSHASGLPAPMKVSLTISKGKRAPFVVQPLPAGRADQKPADGEKLDHRRHAVVRWFSDRGVAVTSITEFIGVGPDLWDAGTLDRLNGIAQGVIAGDISLDDAFSSSAPTAAEVDPSDDDLDPDRVDPAGWRDHGIDQARS